MGSKVKVHEAAQYACMASCRFISRVYIHVIRLQLTNWDYDRHMSCVQIGIIIRSVNPE